MVVWVQLGAKRVKKINQNNDVVFIYDSIEECKEKEKISDRTLRRIIKQQILYNNYFYQVMEESLLLNVTCDNCGQEFKCSKSRVESRKNIFCSKKCEGEFRKRHTIKNCVCRICGKEFHVKPSVKEKGGGKYCSIKCHCIAKKEYMSKEKNHQYGLKGEKNGSWKSNIRISHYGYRLIRALDHPFKNTDGFVFEHRLVAEKHLLNAENMITIDNKEYLSDKYVVHHKDFDRLNNSVNNLEIMERKEHTKLHKRLEDVEALKKYCNLNNFVYEKIYKNKYNWQRDRLA